VAKLHATGEAIPEAVSLMARLSAESELDAVRHRALRHLAESAQAQTEYDNAYDAQMRRRHLRHSDQEARKAATEAAETARWRTAHHLLKHRIRALQAQRTRTSEPEASGTSAMGTVGPVA
jgi:hypothetical protein